VREILGLALYRRERFRQALRELQAYRRLTGRLDQNHLIADSHRAVGASDKAVVVAREALDPSTRLPAEARAEAAIVAGAALADLGRYEEALTLLRRYDRGEGAARPSDLRVWYVIGDVLERAGRPKDAARVFRRILDHDAGAFDVAERLSRLR
jgi:tetratricopeptide (TPR) repeat protein